MSGDVEAPAHGDVEAPAHGDVEAPTHGDGGLSARVDPLAWVVFVGLVIASFAAFGLSQYLKHTPTAVQAIELSPSVSPGLKGGAGFERISFRIQRTDRVTVTVIDLQGNTIRTIASDRPLKANTRLSLHWNGLRRNGRPAPAGTYRINVDLLGRKRQVFSPSSFEVLGS